MKTNTYGRAAVEAAKNAAHGSPVDAWERSVQRLFPDQPASQKKGCPKGAFLGLCEEGMVADVPRGKYTRSKSNKAYALRAIQLLKAGAKPQSARELWSEIMNGEAKTYNNQCDVVLALWDEQLIAHK